MTSSAAGGLTRLACLALLAPLALGTLVPHEAPAQERVATAADLPTRLAAPTRQAIERLADSLRTEGLPADAIFAKAAEGVLKGAEDSRILLAVRRLAHALGEARAALGASAGDAELVAGASALQSGASTASLHRLREVSVQGPTAPRAALATPLVVLTDLLTRHVPVSVATAAIESLVTRQAPAEDFEALRAAVERDIDAGRAPEAATVLRTRSLLQTLDERDRPADRRARRPFLPRD